MTITADLNYDPSNPFLAANQSFVALDFKY